jgi:hypothetical protein
VNEISRDVSVLHALLLVGSATLVVVMAITILAELVDGNIMGWTERDGQLAFWLEGEQGQLAR